MAVREGAVAIPRHWPIRKRNAGRYAIALFILIVAGHWLEHVVQAVQIHALGLPPPQALGALGELFPGLVSSEWLHFGSNLALFAGLVMLVGRFTAGAGRWWMAALVAQGWHFFEHLLLFAQAQSGVRFFGTEKPSSVLQLVVPRADLHLVYNGVVTLLMVIAVAAAGGAIERRRVGAATTR